MIYLYGMSVEENEFLYGPGRRVVIWTKGCSIGCFGCTSKHLWTREHATLMTQKELLGFILKQHHLEGVTLHGGEPTEQIPELLPVIKKLKEHHLSVILFTGREIEDFESDEDLEFIHHCDIVKCGSFDLSKLNRFLQFRGSTNQRVIMIGNRYKDYQLKDGKNVVLLDIDKNGILINKGFPDQEMDQLISEFSIRKETSHDSQRQVKRDQCKTG